MNNRTSYILVGLFVLGLATTFIMTILWLGSGSAGTRFNTYLVLTTDSVGGLSRDGVVKYRGVDVGHVRSIRLDPADTERVRLELDIQEGTPIKQDTVATLDVHGLTGLAYINLEGGSRESPPLPPRDRPPYPQIQSLPSVWGHFDNNIGRLLENLVTASEQLNTWLGSENRELLIRTLEHLEELSGTLAQQSVQLESTLQDLATSMRNVRRSSEQAPALVEQLTRTAQAFERMAATYEKTGTHLDKVIGARDRELQRFTSNSLPEASAMITDLRQTAANLLVLSDRLKRDPGVLLRGASPGIPGPGEMTLERP